MRSPAWFQSLPSACVPSLAGCSGGDLLFVSIIRVRRGLKRLSSAVLYCRRVQVIALPSSSCTLFCHWSRSPGELCLLENIQVCIWARSSHELILLPRNGERCYKGSSRMPTCPPSPSCAAPSAIPACLLHEQHRAPEAQPSPGSGSSSAAELSQTNDGPLIEELFSIELETVFINFYQLLSTKPIL